MKKKIMGLCAALVGGLLLSGCWLFGTAGSIGVIGGADGPTAIYTTTQLAPRVLMIVIPLVIIVAVVALGIFLYIRRKKK